MKYIFILFLVFMASGTSYAQTVIKPEEVNKHVGDSITVCGKVDDLRFFESSRNSPTFLNIGGRYPNQLLTVVIWGDVRKQFKNNIDELKNKQVCITGRIILYKERPEIIISQPSQISVE